MRISAETGRGVGPLGPDVRSGMLRTWFPSESGMRAVRAGGGWRSIGYAFRKARQAGGLFRFFRALRSRNACKTCALGMGGQKGGMVNESGRFPEVCKKSIQAMAADMQGAIRQGFFSDFTFEKLNAFTPRELESTGRLTEPLYAGPLDTGYRPIEWDEALRRIAEKMKLTAADDSFFYFSGRSSNEAGFLLQLFARLYGTNNVNNCSYYCHQASGVGLSSVTGSGTATVVLEDLDDSDLLILIGANPASNHPRLMRTIIDLRRRGGKVIVINPLREIGLVRFKLPSDVRSLLFGSKIADEYVQPHIGGDIALMMGVAKGVLERGDADTEFIEQHTNDWPALRERIESTDWATIIEQSGVDRATIDRITEMYCQSKRTIFCWAMGVTHHKHGVENVQMIGNLALLRGMVGRPGCGLLPLRGHSNVQGIGSIGAAPKLKEAVFERLERTFNVKLPTAEGLDTLSCIEKAGAGGLRFAWCLGGNLYGSNPDSAFAGKAFRKIDSVVYLSTTLNTGHVHGRGRETIVLPVLARDEEPQATTQESMFNFVRLSDGGKRRHEGPRAEVDVIATIAQMVLGDDHPVDFESMRQYGDIRQAIAKIIPGYEKIGQIDEKREEFQVAGRTFHTPTFATETGRAAFHDIELPKFAANGPNDLRLTTVRSEGQFNTVVYEEEDIYRGQERRDVIMMNSRDIERMGLSVDQRVTVRSSLAAMRNLLVRAIDIPAGNAVMYYPEVNVLVPRTEDAKSHTPAFKHVRVTIETGG